MKIEVTAKEIQSLYNELNGITWALERQADSYQSGQDFSKFGIKVEVLACGGAHGISHELKADLADELTEVTKKFLERRKKEITDRFAELKLPIE